VFVYVKAGLEGKKFPAPSTPVEITQQGCEYHPHVFGIQVGQKLLIKNEDPTLHNIHARATVNSEFNVGQPNKGMSTTKSFDKVEVMLPFRCDVHNWMNAFAGVLDHPYYAVTGDDGSFKIANLPPGTYTLVAWQEKLGTQTATITVAAKDTKEAAFTFKGQ
jgi:plastocyanin